MVGRMCNFWNIKWCYSPCQSTFWFIAHLPGGFVTEKINNAKLCVPVFTLFINDNIKFLENIKQKFKRIISWNKYRSKIATQTKNNNLDYLIDSTFSNINRFFLWLKNLWRWSNKNSFDKCFMPLVEIKEINAIIDNK